MAIYVVLVGISTFAVSFLLILGTNRLLAANSPLRRVLLGALFGAAHAMLCTATDFRLFSGFAWNIVFLFLSGLLAFGLNYQSIGKCFLYAVLSMALSCLTASTGGGLWMGLLGAAAIFFLCANLVSERNQQKDLLPVELYYGDEKISIWALRDTGNTLKDPISGKPVLVVGPKVAIKLLGLTQNQLDHPVESVGDLPGLRLIPYRTVGKDNGFLLGMRLSNIKIGNWQGSSIVAFAPCGLGEHQAYQALTGGNL